MTKEEYDLKKKQLDQAYEKSKIALAKEFALSNNPHQVGEIISDTNGRTIKIEKIQVYLAYGNPKCVYSGVWLKKDGTPNKRGEIESIYQK